MTDDASILRGVRLRLGERRSREFFQLLNDFMQGADDVKCNHCGHDKSTIAMPLVVLSDDQADDSRPSQLMTAVPLTLDDADSDFPETLGFLWTPETPEEPAVPASSKRRAEEPKRLSDKARKRPSKAVKKQPAVATFSDGDEESFYA